MIEVLEITNFQSHKETDLVFSKGVNVIVGVTDSGKSGIIRALHWLINNRPTGDSFRSFWGGETSVMGVFDGIEVGRVKSDKVNEYFVGNTDFKAFGTSVPDEVSKALNFSETNLQYQLDSPFLLSETPGAVAKHFNSVANLDKIDLANARIRKKTLAVSNSIKFEEEQLKKHQQSLKDLPDLEKIEGMLVILEQQKEQKNNLEQSIVTVTNNIVRIREIRTEEKSIGKILTHEEKVDFLLEKLEQKKKVENDINKIQNLNKRLSKIDDDIIYYEKVIALESRVNDLINLSTDKRSKESRLERLERLLREVQRTERKAQEMQEKAVSLEEKFHSEMKGTCPLCGSLIE